MTSVLYFFNTFPLFDEFGSEGSLNSCPIIRTLGSNDEGLKRYRAEGKIEDTRGTEGKIEDTRGIEAKRDTDTRTVGTEAKMLGEGNYHTCLSSRLCRRYRYRRSSRGYERYRSEARYRYSYQGIGIEDARRGIEAKRDTVPEGFSIQIEAPIKKILRRLRDRGIISRRRPWPIHVACLTNVSDGDIVNWFAGIAISLLSYYRCCDNLYQVRTIVDYQIRWSAIFTLAHKHKSSARNIILKYSFDLNIVNQEGGKTLAEFPNIQHNS